MIGIEKNINEEYRITCLDNIQAARKVFGMYLGEEKTAVNHMFIEILNNSVDEYLAGFCKKIKICLYKNNFISIEDDGRGIPIYFDEDKNMSALELVLTTLHSGGKFDKKNYKISGGIHGVGSSVVVANSEKFNVVVKKGNKEYSMSFEKGKKVKDLFIKNIKKNETGTYIKFSPDKEVFKNYNKFDSDIIQKKILEISFLCRGLEIEFIDENTGFKKIYDSNNDISNFVDYLSPANLISSPVVIIDTKTEIFVDIALQWVDDSSIDFETCRYFTNNIYNHDGGSHAIGFKSSLTRVINNYINNSDLPKNSKISLSGDDIREGLVAVVSIRHPNPQFSSQTKDKLVSDNARNAVENAISFYLPIYLDNNINIAKKIIIKCINSFKAREAAKKAKEVLRKTNLSSSNFSLSGKLADCSSKDVEKCELFITEGQSAGGCLSGDTLIKIANGGSKKIISLEDLINEDKYGRKYWCYTFDNKKNNIITKLIESPRLTKIKAKVIKLILNNGSSIICTPSHKFMLNDGSFIEAKFSLNKKFKNYYSNITSLEVIEIIDINEKINVFDIEVPFTHNFCLDSGIFAHNSAKQGRDREFQAILPLKGKVLNIEKVEFKKIIDNEELAYLIAAIGCGIGKTFNPKTIRYGKIILFSDADVDGAHIRTLLLTFFFRQMPQLIINGNIYIAQPPLYKVEWKKNFYYLKDDNYLKQFIKNNKIDKNMIKITYLKGLGELSSSQLWESSMNPETRTLLKVNINNFVEADRVFNILMGNNVDIRKDFIINNSSLAKLDI